MLARAFVGSIVLSLGMLGCGDDDGATPDSGSPEMDAGESDAGTERDLGAAPDVGPSDGGDDECEVTGGPSDLPHVEGTFVIVGVDGGPAEEPTPTGGEMLGVWVLEGATVYLPPDTAGLVDAPASSIDGTGWFRVDPPEGGVGRYALRFDLEITLETTVVGTVRRPGSNRSRGTYTIGDAGLVSMIECSVSGSMGMGAGSMGMLGFSREGLASTAQMFVEIVGEQGRSLFVADLRLVE